MAASLRRWALRSRTQRESRYSTRLQSLRVPVPRARGTNGGEGGHDRATWEDPRGWGNAILPRGLLARSPRVGPSPGELVKSVTESCKRQFVTRAAIRASRARPTAGRTVRSDLLMGSPPPFVVTSLQFSRT